jgi:hypothetical protein
VLSHQLIQLSLLQHLAECADRKAQYGNGRAEMEGLLQRPGGSHFVVAQADAKPSWLAVSTGAATLLWRSARLVGHDGNLGVRRKCAVSTG